MTMGRIVIIFTSCLSRSCSRMIRFAAVGCRRRMRNVNTHHLCLCVCFTRHMPDYTITWCWFFGFSSIAIAIVWVGAKNGVVSINSDEFISNYSTTPTRNTHTNRTHTHIATSTQTVNSLDLNCSIVCSDSHNTRFSRITRTNFAPTLRITRRKNLRITRRKMFCHRHSN